jgi:hypothetical protein
MKRVLSQAPLAAWFAGVSVAGAQSGDVGIRSTRGSCADAKERVFHAIENRGLVLNYTGRIGAMLERTGKDIRAARRARPRYWNSAAHPPRATRWRRIRATS